jgi:hypothetical protein
MKEVKVIELKDEGNGGCGITFFKFGFEGLGN